MLRLVDRICSIFRPRKAAGVFVGRKRFRDSSYFFTKLDSKIIHSSVWMETLPTKIVWITMLAMCDQFGRVGASIPGLAKAAGVTIEECQAALEKFLAPDPYSRNPKNEGRRIEVINRGWRVLNYEENRAQVDEEYQRRRKAKNQAEYEARKKAKLAGNEGQNLTGSGQNRSGVVISDPITEVEVDVKDKEQGLTPSMVVSGVLEDLQLSGMELRVVLEDVCRMAMKAGTSADHLRASLVSAWLEFEQAKPKLSYAWGAKAFFGEGHWRNKSCWPWTKGQEPKSRRYAQEDGQ
jgi:hypothetical protein